MVLNLSGQDLSRQDLTGSTQDLVKANLRNAVLMSTNLSGLNLTEADLTEANLFKASLTGTDLTRAVLTRANLDDSMLYSANLTDANLTRTRLFGANFTSAVLTGADLTGAEFAGTVLARANLTGANLTEADIYGSLLFSTNLIDANLTRARLSRSNLSGANLTRADLTGANLTRADLTGANLTGAILEGADLTDAILTDVIGYNPNQNQEEIPNEPISPELQELMNNIKVFDIIMYDDVSATEFFEENNGKQPYIIRNSQGLYTGAALGWPAPSSSGNEFIECADDTPASWNGNSYSRYIKPNARKFIKIIISGSPTMVIKPDWYDSKQIPGTKFFQLVDTGEPVFKFMTTVLASQNLPSDFTALGSDHCNQTSPIGTYKLEPITIEELNQYATTVGGKNKRKKTRKMNKLKKTKKTRKMNKLKKTKKLYKNRRLKCKKV